VRGVHRRGTKEDTGKEPENAYAALGFRCVNLIADAITRAEAPIRTSSLKPFWQPRLQGVTGTISYSRLTGSREAVSIVGIRNGVYRRSGRGTKEVIRE